MKKISLLMALVALPVLASANTNLFSKRDFQREEIRREKERERKIQSELQQQQQKLPQQQLQRSNSARLRAATVPKALVDSILTWNADSTRLQNKQVYEYGDYAAPILSASYYWTGTAWSGQSKTESTYDAQGRKTSNINYGWDWETGDWVGQYKTESKFDAAGRQLLNASYNWDETKKAWRGSSKYESGYDANGNEILNAFYNWDETKNDWQVSEKSESTYDDKGNPLTQTDSEWDDELGKLVERKRQSEYTFGAGNIVTNAVISMYDESTSTWVVAAKMDYTNHDAKGNPTVETLFMLDGTAWLQYQKGEYAYDANGNETLEAVYRWDSAKNDWVGRRKSEYTYDANGNETSYTSYGWDSAKNDWAGSYKDEYRYINGERETSAQYQWDSAQNAWAVTSKYEYDANGNKISYINNWQDQKWENTYDADGNLSVVYFYDNDEASGISVYYYTTRDVTPPTSIAPAETTAVSVYPNPVTDGFKVSGIEGKAKLVVWDITGRIVSSKTIVADEYVSISNLPQGIYIVKISTNTGSVTQKIVKR